MLWGWLSGFLISHFYGLCTLVFLLFAMAIALGRILFSLLDRCVLFLGRILGVDQCTSSFGLSSCIMHY